VLPIHRTVGCRASLHLLTLLTNDVCPLFRFPFPFPLGNSCIFLVFFVHTFIPVHLSFHLPSRWFVPRKCDMSYGAFCERSEPSFGEMSITDCSSLRSYFSHSDLLPSPRFIDFPENRPLSYSTFRVNPPLCNSFLGAKALFDLSFRFSDMTSPSSPSSGAADLISPTRIFRLDCDRILRPRLIL